MLRVSSLPLWVGISDYEQRVRVFVSNTPSAPDETPLVFNRKIEFVVEGSYTFTPAVTGPHRIVVVGAGGGGGGGTAGPGDKSSAGGGGGGGVAIGIYNLARGGVVTVTVGAGGVGVQGYPMATPVQARTAARHRSARCALPQGVVAVYEGSTTQCFRPRLPLAALAWAATWPA